MTRPTSDEIDGRLAFEKELGTLRPRLHRYCSRMVSSAVDGEDLVQEVLVKAIEVFPQGKIDNLESWLFRVAHNAAVDFLRRRKRHEAMRSDEAPDMIIDTSASATDRVVAATRLEMFMHLPLAQRGCVVLTDVLGYSLREVADITGLSVPAVKAALHRGRTRIRELSNESDDSVAPTLSQEEIKRLTKYADRFNARDFDSVRDMLADDIRLELVARTRLEGREQVSRYFHNYSGAQDWRLVPGLVDRRPALLVVDPNDAAAPPSYFVLLEWIDGDVAAIRDFRHARYAAESATMILFDRPTAPSLHP
ncbi:MAG: sigma-70 family RNA polymerase sigma factor [Bradyrhizobium sp.]|nr:MAG: sigma-70 family RNA polymerase sigma factor [Bradyrhizobium sp.]